MIKPSILACAAALTFPGLLHLAAAEAAESPAPAVGLAYRSAWSGYRAWQEPEAPSWRAVNERVAAVGGWRAYLKQVREAQAAPPATAPAAPTGAPAKPQ